jgi:hypothetical protein
MDLVKIAIDAAIFILELTVFIYIGLFLAEVACKRKKLLRIGFIFEPLVKLCKLPRCCALYFLMCLVNVSSATPALLGFYKKGLVRDDKQVITATITAGLPIVFWNVIFLIGVIAIGLFGLKKGILFLLVFVSMGLIQAIIGIIYGRVKLSGLSQGHDCDYEIEDMDSCLKEKKGLKEELKEAFKDSLKTLAKILKILAPVIFLLYVIINSEEIMIYVNAGLRPIAVIFPVESEALPIAITAAFNLIVALSMAQQLIAGGLPVIDVFMAIIVGMFLYNIFDLFHSIIPYNVAFFGRKLGLRLSSALFLSVGISELVVIMMLWSIKVIA